VICAFATINKLPTTSYHQQAISKTFASFASSATSNMAATVEKAGLFETMVTDAGCAGDKDSYYYLQKIGMADGYEDRVQEMAEDKKEREDEWEDDMMQYERAGLDDEDEIKKIPKLDETNNESYRYLRSIGCMWQYDPKEPHHKLKNRLYRRFDTFDKDSDGIMTIDEVLYWADRMKTLCKANEEEVDCVRDAIRIFFRACGLNKEGLHRENWVEANQCFGEAERQRKARGEQSIVALLGNAYYDVLDEDGDNLVSLPELKRMMNVFRVPEEAAYTFFKYADVDGNGMLEREEMHALFHKFWLEKYDPKLDGIYAYKY